MFVRARTFKSCSSVRLEVRVLTNSEIKDIQLITTIDGDFVCRDLEKIERTGPFDIWAVSMRISNTCLSYRFLVTCERESFIWNSKGISPYSVTDDHDFKYYAGLTKPRWTVRAVFYQILIDRFCKGRSILSKRDSQSDKISSNQDLQGNPRTETPQDGFRGGDLRGIESKLAYFNALGINVLYLTPIFQSPSYHRYDVQDYCRVDPRIGTNAVFARLVQRARARNIRVVLDGPFNHTSDRHRWFDRDAKHKPSGAFQSVKSPYLGFYYFRNHPNQYDCFWGVKTMPKLNYSSATLRKKMFGISGSYFSLWLRDPYQIAGWRLDATPMIGRNRQHQINNEVLSEIYSNSKRINSDCVIIGEHPFSPTDLTPYKHVDGITNYAGFFNPVRMWLKNPSRFTTEMLADTLEEFRSRMGLQFVASSLNFLGNHDTSRLASELRSGPKYNLGVIMLFTYPGIPCVYYGEEIALQPQYPIRDRGFGKNDSRICMSWEPSSRNDILSLYKLLISFRKKNNAVQSGSCRFLSSSGRILCFTRFTGDVSVLVILNNGPAVRKYSVDVKSLGIRNGTTYYHVLRNLETTVVRSKRIDIKSVGAYEGIILSSSRF